MHLIFSIVWGVCNHGLLIFGDLGANFGKISEIKKEVGS